MNLTDEERAKLKPGSFGRFSGIGRLSHAGEVLEASRIQRSFELRLKKGKIGTHQGRRKKRQEAA